MKPRAIRLDLRTLTPRALRHTRLAAERFSAVTVGSMRRRVARFNEQCARVAFTSDEIARRVEQRQTGGEKLRADFFGGPGTEGDTIAAFALLAAEDEVEPANLITLADIVSSAAFDRDVTIASALLRISAVRESTLGSESTQPPNLPPGSVDLG